MTKLAVPLHVLWFYQLTVAAQRLLTQGVTSRSQL
jgi:hypothetical protein